jgi:hypothetical protein
MPIRFPTEAANDPGTKPQPGEAPGLPADVGADGTPRGRADGMPEPRDTRTGGPRSGDEKPQPPRGR